MNDRSIALEKIHQLLGAGTLPALDRTPRPNREAINSLEEKLTRAFSAANLSPSTKTLVRSLVLLWHDHLDESHSISQEIHSADGSFLHGIMHRREPDYGNAKYWFHRAGNHECFPTIARRTTGVLEEANARALKTQLIPHDDWDAFAFIDACEHALRQKCAATIFILQRIQEIEFKALLEHFLH